MIVFDKNKIFFRKAYKNKYLVYISSETVADDICIGMVTKAPIFYSHPRWPFPFEENKTGWYLSDDDGDFTGEPFGRRIDAAEAIFDSWQLTKPSEG